MTNAIANPIIPNIFRKKNSCTNVFFLVVTVTMIDLFELKCTWNDFTALIAIF